MSVLIFDLKTNIPSLREIKDKLKPFFVYFSTSSEGNKNHLTGPRYLSSQASVSLMYSTRGGIWSVS